MGDTSTDTTEFAIVGLGAVGTALARRLCALRAARAVRLYSRREEVARSLALELSDESSETATAVATLREAALGVAGVLCCVRDAELADLGRRFAEIEPSEGAVLLHTSGFHSREVFAPAAAAGWSTGVLHPLHAFPPEPKQGLGAQRTFAVEGAPEALAWAGELVARIGGNTLELTPGDAAKARYHAAASLLSNGFVALFDASDELLATASSASAFERRRALMGLLLSSLENVTRDPAEEALTGAVARGERDVVAGHLEALADRPGLSALYRALSSRMVELARRGERAPADLLDEIEALL